MDALHRFIDANMVILIFAYGLVYFAAGLAIALQHRQLSSFHLARHLWLLAAFGIIYGAAAWGDVFIPIQSTYLTDVWIQALIDIQKLAWAVSYAFLLAFAAAMISIRLPWGKKAQRSVRWLAVCWSALVALAGILLLPPEAGESLIRYLLGFPAAMLAAAAFILERKSFGTLPAPEAKTDITMTAATFGLFAIFGGLIVPVAGVWPLAWLNYGNVFAVTGFPIQLYGALAGLAMAYFLIRTLLIFDLEVRQRLEAVERSQSLIKDRQRIARDLHDGTIQTIYASGLQLEAAVISLKDRPEKVEATIRSVLHQLNTVIADIRQYIFDSGPGHLAEADFDEMIRKLLEEFSAGSSIETHLSVRGVRPKLPRELMHNLGLIIHECLGNIARHSLAANMKLEFDFLANRISCLVEDDGIGIDSTRAPNPGNHYDGRGLHNVAARARIIGAEISISRASAQGGTRIELSVPLQSELNTAGRE